MTLSSLSELMSDKDVFTIHPDDTVRNACLIMSANGVGALPVVQNDGKVQGILSERDVIRRSVVVYRSPDKTYVRDIMTPDPICLPPDASPSAALEVMLKGRFRHVPVCAEGNLVGVVSMRDFHVRGEWRTESPEPGLLIA